MRCMRWSAAAGSTPCWPEVLRCGDGMNGPEPDQASLHRAALSRDARAARSI